MPRGARAKAIPKEDDIAVAGNMKLPNELVNQWLGSPFAHPDEALLQEQSKTHTPYQSIQPMSAKQLSAAAKDSPGAEYKVKRGRQLYMNPMQDLDYRVFETIYRNSFIGTLIESLTRYIIGRGFEPVLELINPDKEDAEHNRNMISDNQEIITRLKQIDNYINQNTGFSDLPFEQKIGALITSTLGYNRGALVFKYSKDYRGPDDESVPPIEIEGERYPQIPVALQFAHARDLGMVEVDEATRQLVNVQYRYSYPYQGTLIPPKDMIYLWNAEAGSKIQNSWFYGSSVASPLLSAAKLLDKLLSEDFPAMAQTAWASLFFIVAKNSGGSQAAKRKEWERITSNLKAGTPGVIIKDPEELDVHTVDFQPKTQDFVSLMESLIKISTSVIGLPQVGFFDEAAANYATLVGKIKLTTQTVIEPRRTWIGDMIAKQWYMRWFRLMYADNQEVLDTFRIRIKWSDLHITDWRDDVQAVMQLDGRHQLTDEAIGDLLSIDDYPSMTDPDAETNAGGSGGGGQGEGMPGQGQGPQGPGQGAAGPGAGAGFGGGGQQ